MKKILLFVVLTFSIRNFQSQTISCGDLAKYIVENYETKDTVQPFSSSMLVKATWYQYDGNGYVIAYLKSNDYDFQGRPYIFCGISRTRWDKFKNEGLFGSYGKAFHDYIMDYTCNCE